MADRLPGPVDPTHDSYERALQERLRQSFAGRLRLDPSLGAFLRPVGPVSPLEYPSLPPLLPGLRALPINQLGRGPTGAQPLQPKPLRIVNPVKRVLIQVFIGKGDPPVGFTPMTPEQSARFLRAFDAAKANPTPSQPSAPQPPAPAQPAPERKVSAKVTAEAEFAETRKPDGTKELSQEVALGLEVTWVIVEGLLEFTDKVGVSWSVEKGEAEPLRPKYPEIGMGAELAVATPELERFGLNWKLVGTAEIYQNSGYRTAVIGGAGGVGLEVSKGKRAIQIKFIGKGEVNLADQGRGDAFGLSTSLGVGASVTVFSF